MSMELLNQFMNDAVDFTFTAIVLALTLFALAAMQEYGVVKKNVDSILYPSQSRAREQER